MLFAFIWLKKTFGKNLGIKIFIYANEQHCFDNFAGCPEKVHLMKSINMPLKYRHCLSIVGTGNIKMMRWAYKKCRKIFFDPEFFFDTCRHYFEGFKWVARKAVKHGIEIIETEWFIPRLFKGKKDELLWFCSFLKENGIIYNMYRYIFRYVDIEFIEDFQEFITEEIYLRYVKEECLEWILIYMKDHGIKIKENFHELAEHGKLSAMKIISRFYEIEDFGASVFWAARKGHMEMLKWLVETFPEKEEEIFNHRPSPINMSARDSQFESVEYLHSIYKKRGREREIFADLPLNRIERRSARVYQFLINVLNNL